MASNTSSRPDMEAKVSECQPPTQPPPLAALIAASNATSPVWPDPAGSTRGQALYPLYPSAPLAARSDPQLYEFLALVDAIRIGNVREQQLAESLLKERLL